MTTLVLGITVIGCRTTTTPDKPKFSDAANMASSALHAAIQKELVGLPDHPWAGNYYEGDGMGENIALAIAPVAGYVFEWHGCMGLYDRNYGSVACENGKLRLSFTFKNERKGFQGIAKEFIPVPWGQRTYLVPADDVIGFCNAVNGGMEPRDDLHGRYLLREVDKKKDVSGLPVVPDEYRGYLLTKPITAEIIGVGPSTTRPSVCEWKFKDTTVLLNAGKDKGLRTGMEMNPVKPGFVEPLVIRKVGDTSSEAVMTQIGEEDPEPQKGWSFSTRCWWIEKKHPTAKGK